MKDLRIAVVQMRSQVGDTAGNLARIERFTREAAGEKGDIQQHRQSRTEDNAVYRNSVTRTGCSNLLQVLPAHKHRLPRP